MQNIAIRSVTCKRPPLMTSKDDQFHFLGKSRKPDAQRWTDDEAKRKLFYRVFPNPKQAVASFPFHSLLGNNRPTNVS
jgi:hypothetical protein